MILGQAPSLNEKIKGMDEWANLQEETKDEVIRVIDMKCCESVSFNNMFICDACSSNIKEIELDINSINMLENKAMEKIFDFINIVDKKIEKIKISEYFPKQIDNLEDFKESLEKFSKDIDSFLKEGIKVIIDWN